MPTSIILVSEIWITCKKSSLASEFVVTLEKTQTKKGFLNFPCKICSKNKIIIKANTSASVSSTITTIYSILVVKFYPLWKFEELPWCSGDNYLASKTILSWNHNMDLKTIPMEYSTIRETSYLCALVCFYRGTISIVSFHSAIKYPFNLGKYMTNLVLLCSSTPYNLKPRADKFILHPLIHHPFSSRYFLKLSSIRRNHFR